jgi:hypothetical protein
MAVNVTGLEEAIKALRAQAERVEDLTPAMKVFGRYVEKNVDDCFDQSRDWSGVPFPPLAESTIERRIGSLKAANKRTKDGKLTKGSQRLREKLLAPGGIKPLIDTGRARNSQHTDAEPDGIVWTAVGYLGYHFEGYGILAHLPARNVSPFVFRAGDFSLHPRARQKLDEIITGYVMRGEPGSDAAE